MSGCPEENKIHSEFRNNPNNDVEAKQTINLI